MRTWRREKRDIGRAAAVFEAMLLDLSIEFKNFFDGHPSASLMRPRYSSAVFTGYVLFFPESGVVFSHTHSCAFVCMRVHSYAFHCFLHAFRRAAFYNLVAFERILQPL
jgi:hypothetical protein